MSDELRKHMQGKACFNFKAREPALFKELKQITKNGYQAWKKLIPDGELPPARRKGAAPAAGQPGGGQPPMK